MSDDRTSKNATENQATAGAGRAIDPADAPPPRPRRRDLLRASMAALGMAGLPAATAAEARPDGPGDDGNGFDPAAVLAARRAIDHLLAVRRAENRRDFEGEAERNASLRRKCEAEAAVGQALCDLLGPADNEDMFAAEYNGRLIFVHWDGGGYATDPDDGRFGGPLRGPYALVNVIDLGLVALLDDMPGSVAARPEGGERRASRPTRRSVPDGRALRRAVRPARGPASRGSNGHDWWSDSPAPRSR